MKAASLFVVATIVVCGIASSQQVEEATSIVYPYTAITPGALSAEPEKAKALLESAEKSYENLLAACDVGTVSPRELYPSSKRWMEVEVNLAKTKSDARKAVGDHLVRMNKRLKKIEALNQAGVVGGEQENLYSARFAVTEAEILFRRAGGELPEKDAK